MITVPSSKYQTTLNLISSRYWIQADLCIRHRLKRIILKEKSFTDVSHVRLVVTVKTNANNSNVELPKYFIKNMYLYIWNFNVLLNTHCLMLIIYNFLCTVNVLQFCKSELFKWRGSGKCHIQLTMRKYRRWWIYCNTFKVCLCSWLPQQTRFLSEIVFCAV